MPKIADIQETPNPNAVKFILKEPVSHGTSHSFKDAEAAANNDLARSIFEVGEVVSGLDVVQTIVSVPRDMDPGSPTPDRPLAPVTIESVTIRDLPP